MARVMLSLAAAEVLPGQRALRFAYRSEMKRSSALPEVARCVRVPGVGDARSVGNTSQSIAVGIIKEARCFPARRAVKLCKTPESVWKEV